MNTKSAINSVLILISSLLLSCSANTKTDTKTKENLAYVPLWGQAPCSGIRTEAFVNDTISGIFILDTGGPQNGDMQMDSTFFFKNINIADFEQEVQNKIPTGRWVAKNDCAISVNIGNNTFFVKSIIVENYKRKYGEKYPFTGIIGETPFLDKYTVLDMENGKIAFADTLAIDSAYTAVPFVLNKVGQRLVKIEGQKDNSGKEIVGTFLFDTGNMSSGLHLKRSFAENIRMDMPQKEGSSLYWRSDSIKMGIFILNNVLVRKSTLPLNQNRFEHIIDGNGLIGMHILFKFNMILDYKHNVLYLKPNKYFNEDYQEIFNPYYGG